MTNSTGFWRRLSYTLVVLLLGVLLWLRVLTGYPNEWKQVQTGMSITQVRDICGPPTHSSGLKPDTWEVPFFWGAWVLSIGHGEFTQGPDALVESIEICFDHNVFGAKLALRRDRPVAPEDYTMFYRAYGREFKSK